MNATMKIYYYVGAFIMCFTLIIWMKSNSIQQKLKTRRYRVKQIILNNKLTQKVSGKCILTGVMYTWHNIGVVSFLHFRHLLKWDAKWQIILYVLRQFKCKIIQIKCISDFWRCIVVKLLSVYSMLCEVNHYHYQFNLTMSLTVLAILLAIDIFSLGKCQSICWNYFHAIFSLARFHRLIPHNFTELRFACYWIFIMGE